MELLCLVQMGIIWFDRWSALSRQSQEELVFLALFNKYSNLMHTYTHSCIHNTYTLIYTHTPQCTYAHTHTHTHSHVHVHVHTDAHTHTHTHTHICACVCAHRCTHTHTPNTYSNRQLLTIFESFHCQCILTEPELDDIYLTKD